MDWNKACLPCRLVHTTCNGKRPCARCTKLGKPSQCTNVEKKRRGRPPKKRPTEGDADSTELSTNATSKAIVARDTSNEPSSYTLRNSRRTRRRFINMQSSSSSSEPEGDDDTGDDDDDDYRDTYSPITSAKRRTRTPDTSISDGDVGQTSLSKRPRIDEGQPTTPSSPSQPNIPLCHNTDESCGDCCNFDILPSLLDSLYSMITTSPEALSVDCPSDGSHYESLVVTPSASIQSSPWLNTSLHDHDSLYATACFDMEHGEGSSQEAGLCHGCTCSPQSSSPVATDLGSPNAELTSDLNHLVSVPAIPEENNNWLSCQESDDCLGNWTNYTVMVGWSWDPLS